MGTPRRSRLVLVFPVVFLPSPTMSAAEFCLLESLASAGVQTNTDNAIVLLYFQAGLIASRQAELRFGRDERSRKKYIRRCNGAQKEREMVSASDSKLDLGLQAELGLQGDPLLYAELILKMKKEMRRRGTGLVPAMDLAVQTKCAVQICRELQEIYFFADLMSLYRLLTQLFLSWRWEKNSAH
uniref:Uncharacterized protein n=1 Tax=Mycena chlorophos TaxID=658473 RepID=A0ABQ0M6L2_MYCCL|nr:predicted protein [Mycena chlorophos]